MNVWIRDDDYHLGMSEENLHVVRELLPYCSRYHLGFVVAPCQKYFDYARHASKDLENKEVKKILTDNDKLFVSMHGITHEVNNGIPEFDCNISLDKIKEAKKEIEDSLEVKVKSFSPPNNSLSKSNFKKLSTLDFEYIFHAFGFQLYERPYNLAYIKYFLKNFMLHIVGSRHLRSCEKIPYNSIVEYPSYIYYSLDIYV